MRTRMLLGLMSLAAVVSSGAQQEHVSFLVMGKTTNHRQSDEVPGAKPTLLNFHFFAEIFVKDGGAVSGATLSFPDGRVQEFEDLGFVQEVHGGRYDRESELDRSYPNGDYTFRFETPGGVDAGRVLSVRGTGEGRSRIPRAVVVTLSQDGREVSPNAVDPGEDLEITWSEFDTGASDPNGIVDDLLFAVVGNCHGEKIVHSGRPFEGTPYLTYETKRYVVASEKLAPGEPHQLFVEHARVDTSEEDGVVGLVTYAATTFLDFHTTGTASGPVCPPSMPKMDAGQTDRGEPD